MTIESLYVDGYTLVTEGWIEIGLSPWLNNDTGNYIYDKLSATHSEFTFADLPSSGTITSVTIYFECKADDAPNDDGFNVYIYNGTSWQLVGSIKPSSTDWAWESININAILDSVAKVNGTKLYVVMTKVGGADEVYIRKCYLYVDYTPGGPQPGWNKLQYFTEPPTGGAFNKLKFASEPPVAASWNKILYAGE